ncbi:hypothetical protein COHA_005353 [Chlorella ohadii]|uniref:Uncharacterized protein n=1 Tax=Chlorella ohadii TaxID=2649997 RepID=A0AAD5H206_9CHLO|nr:hypothetical protein COHA_005353 [Chlorella ohadii]
MMRALCYAEVWGWGVLLVTDHHGLRQLPAKQPPQVRSAEGRRRVIAEIVRTLAHSPDEQQKEAKGSAAATAAAAAAAAAVDSPFMSRPGCPPPYKVKAFVELAASLLSTTGRPGRAGSQAAQQTAVSAEIVRAMKDAGMVKALTGALQLIDLDHPQAIQSVHAILRPLEILTRAWPKRQTPAAAAAPGAAAGEGAAAAGAAGAGGEGGAGGQAAGGEGAAAGGAGGVPAVTPASVAPEAGRQALRAAEAALENADRDRARAERRSIEEAIEGLMAEEEALLGSDAEMLGGSSDSFNSEEHDGSGMSGSEGEEDEEDESMGHSDDDMGSSGEEDEEGEGPLVVEIDSEDGDGSGSDSELDTSGSDIESDMEDDEDEEDAELAAAEEAELEQDEDEDDGALDLEDGGVPPQLLQDEGEDEDGLELGDGGQTDLEDDYYEEAEEFGMEDDDDEAYLDEVIGDDELDLEAEALREPVDFGGGVPRGETARARQLEAMLDEFGLLRSRNRSYLGGRMRGRHTTASALPAGTGPATQHPLLARPAAAGSSSAAAASSATAVSGSRLEAIYRAALAQGMDPAEATLMQQTLAQALDPLAMPGGGGGTFTRLFESGLAYPGGSMGRMPGGGGGSMAASWGDGDAANTGVYGSLAQVGARFEEIGFAGASCC